MTKRQRRTRAKRARHAQFVRVGVGTVPMIQHARTIHSSDEPCLKCKWARAVPSVLLGPKSEGPPASAGGPFLVSPALAREAHLSLFDTNGVEVVRLVQNRKEVIQMEQKVTAGHEVLMDRIPDCDVGKHHGPAEYDARLPGIGNGTQWGYVCGPCFASYGPGQTGVGHAQRLILRVK